MKNLILVSTATLVILSKRQNGQNEKRSAKVMELLTPTK